MIDFDDLTAEELAVRKLLERPKWSWEREPPNDPFRAWARATREAWARTPEGQRAIAECENRRGKVRRRVQGES